MIYKLAVFGNPIAHSLSPPIHRHFAKQFGIELDYQRILVPVGSFVEYCQRFFDEGGFCCNITAPFKGDAYRFVVQHSNYAKEVAAVNAIVQRDGLYLGDSFDGRGLVNDLTRNKGVVLQDKKIMILGAGGTTRSILPALLAARPHNISIVNRDLEKANAIVEHLADTQKIAVVAWKDLAALAPTIDVLLDATSSTEIIGLVSNYVWNSSLFVYDIKYHGKEKSIAYWAHHQGLQASEGFGMLVEEAALRFQLSFGELPNTQQLIQQGPDALRVNDPS